VSSACDDLGTPLPLARPARRIVSLVPSLTETIASIDPALLVGATDWCVEPLGLDVVRVRGTKNPDVPRIAQLHPDVVLANEEENRPADITALRAAGLAVWVTDVRAVPDGLASLARMLSACGLPRPVWLDDAAATWDAPARLEPPRRAVVPIWRRPWMALGRDTFAGDVLARLGVVNVLAGAAARYPRVDLAALSAHDLVVLPDEPYQFTAEDGPEAFPGVPCALVSGRHLTWYGPSLVEAPTVLLRQLAAAR
jgi:ABC-type Fe3+-hydroxamate transport system substrate-binding protein